ncbi:MAG: ATP-binding protein, partial [Cyclobacteriaceae bacterium]|nr:ATP-binding protein [Cyclobacteriaceae bacterium]
MQYNYKVPCQKKKLVDIRIFISEVLKKHLDSEVDINSLVLAVDEICANLMIHSHQCNPSKCLELFVKIEEEEIIFEITDTGNGFDFKEYKEPSIKDIIIEKKKGGLGLMLVKRIM